MSEGYEVEADQRQRISERSGRKTVVSNAMCLEKRWVSNQMSIAAEPEDRRFDIHHANHQRHIFPDCKCQSRSDRPGAFEQFAGVHADSSRTTSAANSRRRNRWRPGWWRRWWLGISDLCRISSWCSCNPAPPKTRLRKVFSLTHPWLGAAPHWTPTNYS